MRLKISCSFFFFLVLCFIATSAWGTNTTLIPQSLYPGYFDKLTKSEANSHLGVDLFSYPRRGAESFKDDWLIGFVIDSNWDRVVYGDYNDDWIKAFGTTGSEDGQFRCPKGIAADNFGNVYVADFLNGRVVKLHYDFNGEVLSFVQNITGGGMVNPYDVAISNELTPDDPSDDAIWIVDFATHKLYHFSASGEYLSSYGGLGSGVGHFSYPSGVAVLKWYGYDTNSLYIVDTGNHRIVKLFLNNPGDYCWDESYEAPDGSYLTTVDVDYYGDVWVTDRPNCRIFKFTDDLNLLTTFGSEGTGSDQFVQPIDFSHARHHGDYFIIESWTDNSGVQYYWPGVDILNLEAWPNEGHTIVTFSLTLTEYADLTIGVYKGSNLIKTLYSDTWFSAGDWTLTWDCTDANGEVVPPDSYTIKITAVAGWVDEHQNPTYTCTKSVGVLVGILRVPKDYPTIQDAVNAVTRSGCIIQVAPGTYEERALIIGKDIVFQGSGVNATILKPPHPQYDHIFWMVDGANCVIDGFTMTRGLDNVSVGVFCSYNSSVMIHNNLFLDLLNAIDICYSSSATIKYNVITGCYAKGTKGSKGGTAISIFNSTATIINNTITDNWGDAVQADGSDVYISNNILTSNACGISDYDEDCNLTISYNDVWDSWWHDYYNCDPGPGDISKDPRFVDPDNNNYHLQSNSPCIDAGDPNSPHDPDGTVADMGAYYYHQHPGCPYVFTRNGGESIEENNLLPLAELPESEGKDISDYYQIQKPFVPQDGKYKLEVREFENEHSWFDQLQLMAVEHPPEVKVAVSTSGRILGYKKLTGPISAVDSSGGEFSKYVSAEDGLVFRGKGGDELIVNFGKVSGIRRVNLVIGGTVSGQNKRLPKAEPVVIPVPDSKSRTVVGISYRENKYAELVELPGTFSEEREVKVRLLWQIPYDLDFIGLIGAESVPLKIQTCPLDQAVHSVNGPVLKSLLLKDRIYGELVPGQKISLVFSAPKQVSDYERDFVLGATGHYVKMEKSTLISEEPTTESQLPKIFSLSQNYPNPFNPVTEIKYGLPKDCYVNLEIYNILGKKVATLVDGKQKAGYKTARWDASPLASGIYFYRIEAGNFSQTKKMVLLK